MSTAGPSGYETIFIERRPVFDKSKTVFGYELVAQCCKGKECISVSDVTTCASKIIADGFSEAISGLDPDQLLFLNIQSRFLLKGQTDVINPAQVIFVVGPAVRPTKVNIKAVSLLKEKGYSVCLGRYQGGKDRDVFLPFADLVQIPVDRMGKKEIMAVSHKVKEAGGEALATGIADWEAFEGTKFLGFSLFSGPFFAQAEIVNARKLSSSSATRIQLLRELTSEDISVHKVAEIVSSDPSLSYRLLKYVNSAGFELASEIRTINHAVAILGNHAFRQWASLVLMSDIDSTSKGIEVAYVALHRALFLKAVGEQICHPGITPGSMFLAGLFSKIDVLLGMRMEEVLDKIALADDVKEGLLGRDLVYTRWLNAMDCIDRGDWKKLHETLLEFKVPASTSSLLYMKASKQAREALAT